MHELQQLAAGAVARVLAGHSLDAELRALWSAHIDLTPQERGALQDMCYGTLRFLGELDALLALLLDRPLKDERLRDLLRVALYQLVHTRAAAHAVVDHAVRACVGAGLPGAKGLVNGVLRSFLRKRDSLLTAAHDTDTGRYSHPQWWIDKVRAQYPLHHAAMLAAANAHPPLTLRVNERATSVGAYLERAASAGIEVVALGASAVRLARPIPVERIPGFNEGLVSVQDAAAQYAAVFLDAADGARVLDACAAPGGKTAHILERAQVDLLALDCDSQRLRRVEDNLTRLHLSARLACADAAEPSAWWDGKPYTHVLADVPCSASGVVRRHPDIKWLRRPEDIAAFAKRQRTLLDALWQVLGTGGKLLYATCSVFHEENQAQIERFLEHRSDARRLTLPGLHTNAQQLAGQILPDENHDGFFYALLQKG